MIRPTQLCALWLLECIAVAGCASSGQRTAGMDNAALEKRASDKIDRICELPQEQREAEIKKIKAESGLELYCAER